MTPEMLDLALRAVTCKGFHWMPGMLAVGSTRFGEGPFRVCYLSALNLRTDPGALPDFDDAATLGCVLALVREAWSAPRALVRLSANGKSFHVFDVDRVTMGGNWAAFLCGDRNFPTEAHALVAALEAAPEVTP